MPTSRIGWRTRSSCGLKRDTAVGGSSGVTGSVEARHDSTLSARVVRRVALHYAAGADPEIDRPGHVRAASGLAWVGARLAVIQDDANFVALVDPATGLADAVALPPGAGGRRLFDDAGHNKEDKLDYEALTSISTGDAMVLIALGSGSMPRRESIALISGLDAPRAVVQVCAASRFYAGLRACAAFAGSELNLEGAIYHEGWLTLFGRGNGAVRGDMRPVNATCRIEWAALLAHVEDPDRVPPPLPTGVVQYELGSISDERLTFTDATLGWASSGAARAVLYLAVAEASPDAIHDGEVVGSAIGVIEERDGRTSARWVELRDRDGRVLPLKAEGIAPAQSGPGRVVLVVDVDAHDRPSELLEVQLEGPWSDDARQR